MKKSIVSYLLSTFLALGLLGGWIMPVSANSGAADKLLAKQPLTPTKISLVKPEIQDLGKHFILTGGMSASNASVSGLSVIVTIDGKFLGRTRTNEIGLFLLKVNEDLPAGSFKLSANFTGTRLLAPSSTSTTLQIRPSDVRIQTVPPVAGVTFLMDGRQFVSGEDGLAKISIFKSGNYRLEVLVNQYNNPTQRIEFGRWQEESYQSFRDVQVPVAGTIQAGVNVFHQVGLNFVDLEGYPVDPKRISGISIKSLQGDIFNYQNEQARWVPASRVARRQGGLEETKLLYSVISVTVDGSNVVNQSQQRFFTSPNDTLTISLLLYSLQVSAKDALFGSPVGKAVQLKFPDGKTVIFPMDSAGSVKIPSLARGIYQVEIVSSTGLKASTPVALSRNQVVQQSVITYLDLAVVGGLGLLIALSLFFFGRPWLLISRVRRLKVKPPVVRETGRLSIHDQ
jgi:hypothetical protein